MTFMEHETNYDFTELDLYLATNDLDRALAAGKEEICGRTVESITLQLFAKRDPKVQPFIRILDGGKAGSLK